MNNRFRLFIDNIMVYGLGGLISKLIPFLMLPIITRLFPSSFYIGLNDLSVSLVSFLSSFALFGMYDAMFRLFFDREDEDYKKEICSAAFYFVFGVSCLIAVVLYVIKNQVANWYFGSEEYVNLVVLSIVSFLICATNQIVSAPTRIQNKKKVFLVTNTISPIISYSLSVPLIIKGFYIIAMPVASIVSAMTIEISFYALNRNWFSLRHFRIDRLKELLKIGVPLMPNFIVYWIYNSADKLMISWIMGTEFTGIYSVASRIGHISNLIYTAFSGGWLYFAYSTMKDDDQVSLKSKVFEYLAAISFVATACLIAVDRIGFKILFGEEYLPGYLCAPYLFIAPLLLMLFQTIANQFTIIKKTYLNTISLAIGAVINVILNVLLIQIVGMEGAAIATITGYVCTLIICILILTRMKLIAISRRFYICAAAFMFYFLLWRLLFPESTLLAILASILVIAIYAVLYRNDLKYLLKNMKEGKK